MPTYSTAQFRQYVVDLLQQATGLTISIPTILSTAEYRGLVVDLLTVLAQGGGGGSTNATQLQGRNISANAPTNGQVLAWNGTVWIPTAASGGGGTVTSVALSGGATGLTTSGGPITGSGTITLAGTLGVANGGTGATTLTGYVKGSGTAAFTASATVPAADVSGALAATNLPALSGDLTSTAGSNSITVAKLRGQTVSATVPTSGQILKFDGTQWAPAADAGGISSITAGTGLSGGTITTSGTISVTFGTTTGTVTQGGTTVLKAGDSMTGALSIGLNNNSDALTITQAGNGNAFVVGTNALIIDKTGHVGIGLTPNSSHALRVDTGGIFTQGGLTFGDNSVQTTAGVTSLTGDVTTVGAGASAATVAKIRGVTVSATAPTSGQVLKYDGTQWAPATDAGGISSVTAGTGLTGGTITSSGTIAVDFGATTGKVTEGGTTVLKAGDTMTGKLNLTSSATTASINLGADTSVTTPATGDLFIQSVATGATASATAARRLAYVGGDGSRYVIPTLSTVNTFAAAQGVTATSSGTILSATQTAGSGTAIAATQGASATGSGITVDINNAASTAVAVRITNQGTGASFLVEDQSSVDPNPFTISNNGRVGIGVAPDANIALSVDASGIKFSDGTIQITAGGGSAGVSSFSAGTTGLTPSTATTGAVTLAGTLAVSNGGTGATTLTGYVKGNGTSAFTASATVSAADVSGALAASNLPALIGDLSSTAGSNSVTVTKIRGTDVSATAPTNGQVLKYNGIQWVPSAESSGGITALTGDVTASGSGSVVATLANSGVVAGNYGASNAVSVLSIDAKGRVTSASNQTITPAGIGAQTAFTTLDVSKGGTGANTLTGILKGNGTSAFQAAVAGTDYVAPSGSITGTASNVTGIVAIANGGTGQTTAANAINALVPAQTGNSGKVLTTNGSVVSWGDAAAGGGGVDVQQFLASGTWTKPTGAKAVEIIAIGQGSNGGAGSKTMAGITVYGGTGGASGQLQRLQMSAELLPSTLTVTVTSALPPQIGTFFYEAPRFTPIVSSGETSITNPNGDYLLRCFITGMTTGNAMFTQNPSGQTSAVIGGASNGLDSADGNAAGNSVWARNRSSTAGSGGATLSSFRGGAETVSAGTNSFSQSSGGNGTMRWSGTISESSSSGGSGGGNSLNTTVPMLAGNGGDGGSWYAPVTLTSVATTIGSNVVSCASTSALNVGATLVGISGFASNVYVNAILSSTTFSVVNKSGTINATSAITGQTVIAAFGVGGGGGGGGNTNASTPIFVYGVNLTNGSVTVTCSSTRGLLPQMSIYGNANIPDGAKIATLVSETEFTLTAAATGDVSNGKAIVAGRGEVSSFSIAANGTTTTAISSTLGLTWGQGLIASNAALNPPSGTSAIAFCHVGGFSAGNLVLTSNATSSASGATLYVANAYGILDNVTTTVGSAVMTVPDTSVLSVGMLVQVVGSGNWSTTANSTSITSDVSITSSGAGSYFYGEGVKVTAGQMTASGTTITASTSSDVVASCTSKKFYYTKPNNQFVLQTWSGLNLAATRIKSIDSATQITLDKTALQTTSGLSLMYAFTGGTGGVAACGGVRITTYK